MKALIADLSGTAVEISLSPGAMALWPQLPPEHRSRLWAALALAGAADLDTAPDNRAPEHLIVLITSEPWRDPP